MKKKVFLIILTILLTSFKNIKERNICDKNWESTTNNDENYNYFITFKSNGVYNLKIFTKGNNSLIEYSVGKWIKERNIIIITFDNIYDVKLKVISVSKNKLVLEDEENEKLTYIESF